MNTIETIIDAASPLTDYQQLILDCRIYSENEIKKHCIHEDVYYLNHLLYMRELYSQLTSVRKNIQFQYNKFVDNIKNRLNKFENIYGDVDISYTTSNENELLIIIKNCKTISIPYRFIGRILTDNGWYIDTCDYIKNNNQVLIHIKPYDKAEHITFDMLNSKPI